MKKLLTFCIGLIWILAACAPLTIATDKSITITDALDRQVTLGGNPSRIVIVGKQAPMLTNFLYLFETAGEKLTALEKRTQTAEDFLEIIDESIAGKYLLEKGAGAEQVAPLNPDVVIMKASMRETIGKPMEDLSMPVVYVEFENTDQIYRDIRIFAEILKEENRGEQLISSYEQLFKQIEEKVDKDSIKPSVLILQAVSADQKYVFSLPDVNWLQTDLIEKAGGSAVWKEANATGSWADVNMEQISNWDPDLIYIVNYQGKAPEIVSSLEKDEIWMNLKAVKNYKLYAFAFDYLSWDQPDPRWILGYTWMAFRQNPQNFSSQEIQSMVNEFYEKFYDLDKPVIDKNISSKIANYLK